ncbi:MAG TPA: DUF6174 domain-containing protein [Gammaproteobacteria bacterium]|nr:DUF6174 domain-containing protein [Gammaproteobacteria bacterium]
MRSITTLRAALASALALAATSAVADAELDAARARWQSAGLAGYEYGYHKYCECHRDSPPETVVTVRGGKVVGVRHRPVGSTTEVPAADKNLEYYWTVDGLFGLISSAQQRGVQVRAQYDAALGFPREVYIDYDANFIGDELDVRLTGVTAVAATR